MLKTIKNLINICVLSFISNNLYANASGDVNYALSIIDGVDRINEAHNIKLFVVFSVLTIIFLLAKIAFKDSYNKKKKTYFKETSDDKMLRYLIIIISIFFAIFLLF